MVSFFFKRISQYTPDVQQQGVIEVKIVPGKPIEKIPDKGFMSLIEDAHKENAVECKKIVVEIRKGLVFFPDLDLDILEQIEIGNFRLLTEPPIQKALGVC